MLSLDFIQSAMQSFEGFKESSKVEKNEIKQFC